MLAGYEGFQRVAHLRYVPLPGGDAAIKRPYRVALAHLWAAGEAWDTALPPVKACPPEEQYVLQHQLEAGLNAVPTSSMGRLFDAVAALAGVRQRVTYEAQAAIELESLAVLETDGVYAFHLPPVVYYGDPVELDAAPVIRAVVLDVRKGVPAAVIAGRFHRAVADLILEICGQVWEQQGVFRVALSGGVFQNVTLLELVRQRLQAADFEVLTHRQVPPNDGGLALGQAIVGGLMP
jgi:hydrogenase maturation protein HypF